MSVVAALGVAGLGSVAQANQLLGSFEGSLASALPTGSPFNLAGSTTALNPAAGLQYTATGATEGTTSLRLRLPLAFDFGLVLTEGSDKTGLKDAWNANDTLLFDVTVPQINDATGAPDTDGYVVFLGAINSDGTGGGFHQAPANFPLTNGTGDNAYNKGTVTVAWNYRSQGILFPADAPATGPVNFGFTQLDLALNSGGFDSAPVAFFDNFRFVSAPEPTSIAAIATLGSLIARRRR